MANPSATSKSNDVGDFDKCYKYLIHSQPTTSVLVVTIEVYCASQIFKIKAFSGVFRLTLGTFNSTLNFRSTLSGLPPLKTC